MRVVWRDTINPMTMWIQSRRCTQKEQRRHRHLSVKYLQIEMVKYSKKSLKSSDKDSFSKLSARVEYIQHHIFRRECVNTMIFPVASQTLKNIQDYLSKKIATISQHGALALCTWRLPGDAEDLRYIFFCWKHLEVTGLSHILIDVT